MKPLTCALLALVVLAALPRAQPVFTGAEIFPPEEFAARRARVMEKIGDGVAILQGTTERPGEQALRQNNQFFYLTGVVEPRAIAVIDGRSKKTTMFLQPKNERREQRMFGPGLSPGADAAAATGIDEVLPRDDFSALVATLARDQRAIFTPLRPEVLGEASSSDPAALWRATRADPWDGRVSREEQFLAKLKQAAPQAAITDLDPIIDALRAIKSAREIAVIREATRIAGLGIMEAMRDARPGMKEYELQADAEFVFKKWGAYGPSYFALIATGPNTYYSHYHKNTAVLKDGDLVQFDYAPDYKYYQSDVTRVFPAGGRFSPRQREFYGIYLKLYQSVMTSIRPHASAQDILKDAVVKMDAIMKTFTFTDPAIKEAATRFVDNYRKSSGTARSLGHSVGLEVHDVGGAPRTYEPGMIFTIEPAMQIEAEHLGLRLEDMIVITDSGYENLSAFVPVEIDDVEKLMKEPGLSDAMIRQAPASTSAAGAAGLPAFTRELLLETTSETSANVSIGDLNGDGIPDLVLAKGRHWPLLDRVLINDGHGRFPAAHNLGEVADKSYSASLVDLDGDGDLDVIVSNDTPDPKRVYTNDGKGHFRQASTFGDPAWPTRNATVADVNNDRLPDIVVANRGGTDGKTANFICVNRGGGQFGADCTAFSHESATTITAADVNRDGSVDLIVPHRDGGQSYVYLNDGKGGFARRVPFGAGDATIRVSEAADFNGDGLVDIVAIDERLGAFIYFGERDARFSAAMPVAQTKPYALTVGDLNADGKPDIVVGNVEARPVVYFNDGTGRHFTAVPFGDARGTAYGFAIGDLDRDGHPDIAMARSDAPNVVYFAVATGTSKDVPYN
jgi:Xaa-Pro aminopeptidase